MDSYSQPFLGHNYYGFNLLHPSYHNEQSFKVDCGLDDAFGFGPSLTEQTMLDQYPNTADLLTPETYQPPCQPWPMCLLQPNNHHTEPPISQYSTFLVPSVASGAGRTPTEPSCEANAAVIPWTTNVPVVKRRQDQVHSIGASVPPKLHSDSAKTRRRRRARQPSTYTKSPRHSLEVDKRKQLSLEKNRLAASKCRMKKKEENEQMLQDCQTKAKENQVLRNLVRTMKIELHKLTDFLSVHADTSTCQNPTELKEALRILHEANMSKRFSGLNYGPPSPDSPAPSFTKSSPSYNSYGHSPVTPAPPTMQALGSCILGYVNADFLLIANGSEDQDSVRHETKISLSGE